MLNEMNKKELKEMAKYFDSMANNHKSAGREEECGEYREKACNCRHELMSRAAK
jgi:hypothetical protein